MKFFCIMILCSGLALTAQAKGKVSQTTPAKNQKRAPASTGPSTPPIVGELPLAEDTNLKREFYTSVNEMLKNGETTSFTQKDITVEFTLTSRDEPDGPVNLNLLSVTKDRVKKIYIMGPLLSNQKIQQTGSSYTIVGSGGNWYDVEDCKSFAIIRRTLTIKINDQGTPKYTLVQDELTCSSPVKN